MIMIIKQLNSQTVKHLINLNIFDEEIYLNNFESSQQSVDSSILFFVNKNSDIIVRCIFSLNKFYPKSELPKKKYLDVNELDSLQKRLNTLFVTFRSLRFNFDIQFIYCVLIQVLKTETKLKKLQFQWVISSAATMMG